MNTYTNQPGTLLEKIEKVIQAVRDNYTGSEGITVHCRPSFYQTLRENMWKNATIKYRSKWRAHKQQGITTLSLKQWIKENY